MGLFSQSNTTSPRFPKVRNKMIETRGKREEEGAWMPGKKFGEKFGAAARAGEEDAWTPGERFQNKFPDQYSKHWTPEPIKPIEQPVGRVESDRPAEQPKLTGGETTEWGGYIPPDIGEADIWGQELVDYIRSQMYAPATQTQEVTRDMYESLAGDIDRMYQEEQLPLLQESMNYGRTGYGSSFQKGMEDLIEEGGQQKADILSGLAWEEGARELERRQLGLQALGGGLQTRDQAINAMTLELSTYLGMGKTEAQMAATNLDNFLASLAADESLWERYMTEEGLFGETVRSILGM